MTTFVLPSGIYQIYNSVVENSPVGLGITDNRPLSVVTLSEDSPAPLWTITKLADGTYTFSINGSFVAPDSASFWVLPSSVPYGWKLQNLPGYSDIFRVWTSNSSGGWNYLIPGGRRRSIAPRLSFDLLMYLDPSYAYGFNFKRVG